MLERSAEQGFERKKRDNELRGAIQGSQYAFSPNAFTCVLTWLA
jgi:hypothetical protein